MADGFHGWVLGLIGILSLLCASHLAVALVNWLATLLVTPHPLPRMDFSKGIPPECSTLVVVPTMLTSAQNIEDLIEALEVRFLANRDDNLHFGLLTDFRDAHEETLPEDEPLLRLARQRIEELNEKYRSCEGDIFFLFHRPRRWNPAGADMDGLRAQARKACGIEFLLARRLQGIASRSSLVKLPSFANVKYVITLDTDTQLPRDSAWQFVGAMAHPLNRARYDEDKQRVCEGYGILQPEVGREPARQRTGRDMRACAEVNRASIRILAPSPMFTRICSHEGSFIGKGIYEVDAFERALKGRFPENRILSHDLLEGCYARAGLLSDVQLYEEYPSRYSADVSRRRRWIRGDWQIARWLLPGVPGPGAHLQKNPLSALSRWKIFDNLRRSLDARGVDAPVAAGLDGLVIRLVLDLVGDRHHPDSSFGCLASWTCSRSPAMYFWASTSLPQWRYGWPSTSLRLHLRSRVSPTRPFSVWMRSSARPWPDTDYPQAASRMESVGRLTGHPGRTDLAGSFPDDVDRPRCCYCRGMIYLAFSRPAVLSDGWAHTGPLVCLARLSRGGSAGRSLAAPRG